MSKIGPFKENDKRSVPTFIEEFEEATNVIKSDREKGSYFRSLFRTSLYPKSSTMPVDETYTVLKRWFLKTAWNRKARRRYASQISDWTKESVGLTSTGDFLRLVYLRLTECEVSPEDRQYVISELAPKSYDKALKDPDYRDRVRFDAALRRIEARAERYFRKAKYASVKFRSKGEQKAETKTESKSVSSAVVEDKDKNTDTSEEEEFEEKLAPEFEESTKSGNK